MKYILLLQLLFSVNYANISDINDFEADFEQSIKDEKNTELKYRGHIQASKPQFAFWNYTSPISKKIYITSNEIIIIEPEIEQVIIKKINSDFDFFSMIKNAKQISENEYVTLYKESIFKISTKESFIESISYKDEFDNDVKIVFSKQLQNKKIDLSVFNPAIPSEYDVIRDQEMAY
ncbi:outer membrane lipoprotein chaperone LolA [Sulfurimonas aquatica]|uniref:Outer membrane lipoprotein chaperone LolA n=1 Tax=Sulfurimonas aquatica TaxID=2672570 RepID=A0A975GCK8_9BACT|nr:LolA-like outer membrane lipoprotein chaperone [Sulfurimonas aquatica]QSZ41811.1 outer membrane lipoprotein chaperone LolA [Sulfurimonas aquatica]